MTTLQRYKPLPELAECNFGYEPGWDFDVIILQAEPDDKIGSIIITSGTKDDEKGASVVARVIAVSPTAFKSQDWDATGLPPPVKPGDVVYTRRYPAGVYIVGADGRTYMAVKDKEIGGKRIDAAWETKQQSAA
jgi:co-chaperonin GroES (HSP10)